MAPVPGQELEPELEPEQAPAKELGWAQAMALGAVLARANRSSSGCRQYWLER